MSDENRPVLTPVEWREYSGVRWTVTLHDDTGRVVVPATSEAAVALCLNGQSFGFTRNDLDDIRSGILALREQGCDLIADGLDNLGARIAALLPPEPEES